MRKRIHPVTAVLFGGLTLGYLAACGDMSQLKDLTNSKKGGGNDQSAMNLTDQAASAEANQATATSNLAEIVPSPPSSANLPAFMQVVKEARDYTRKLLGLTSDPLREYQAAIEAARALATSPEDFESKIAPARETFQKAIEAQKQVAENAKAQHADALNKIFASTQQVFLACGEDFGRMMDPRGQPHEKGKHGRGGHVHGGDKGKGHGKGKGPGHMFLADQPTSTGTDTASASSPVTSTKADSAACKDATSSLKALITPST